MTQPLFKIGSVYREKSGALVELRKPNESLPWSLDEAAAFRLDGSYEYGSRNLSDGVCCVCPEVEEYHLIPGELHQVDGAWIPITEQPMSVYFADAQEEKAAESQPTLGELLLGRKITAADLEMIARDGISAPKPAVVALPAAPTAHPAIAALTHLGQVDHRFGLGVR